ncbi:hypothetical protein C5G87_11110 [Paenibacillus peoriae]|uniref:hypothetical protein n=1 Tax=Paenibacillus TaxID=44249 RepID=UPI000CEBEB09|nr:MULTISPECIES: hypothetical protein [Paenibacillus]PPQ48622.1 hypothetical protein C5G87_11110 [Paenibacillus peoriae]URJ47622.1 hypothetical protein MF628_002300 [Paenibacillus polymyxa]
MAIRPPQTLKSTGRKVPVTRYRNVSPTQTLRRFTVIWANNDGVPFNTTGFFAILRRLDGSFVQAAGFDGFGTARFSRVRTPTNQPYILRTFRDDGVLFRVRSVPAGVSSFVVIG